MENRKVKDKINFYLKISIVLILIIFFSYGCDDNPQGCIQIDPESCNNPQLKDVLLFINITQYDNMYMDNKGEKVHIMDYTHTIPVTGNWNQIDHIICAGYGNSAGSQNYISGYEINYGFWSKDSFREYTWEEMFEWKYHRKPTQEELSNLTCDEVKQWFKERHTVHRWFYDDEPRDVQCKTVPFTKYCITLNRDITEINGHVVFPDGTKCEIENKTLKRDSYSGNSNTFLVKIKKVCSACQ